MNSRDRYLKALYKQNREFDKKFEVAENRKDDPFYRLQSFEARLAEQEDKYIIRAKVPSHERDRVEIRVKDGKASISAARQHEEKRTEPGSQTSSSTYQTWRQEFALGKPILREAVVKKVDEEGFIEISIPKRS